MVGQSSNAARDARAERRAKIKYERKKVLSELRGRLVKRAQRTRAMMQELLDQDIARNRRRK
jgi:hypothetical protein